MQIARKVFFQNFQKIVENDSELNFRALRVFPAVTWLTVYRRCPVIRNRTNFEFEIPATLYYFEIVFLKFMHSFSLE